MAAAVLLTIVRPDDDGILRRVISLADAQKMTADQIISLFQFDHWPIRFSDGGPSEPWNLEPRPIIEHRRKTAKRDAPEMKKYRRISARLAQYAPVDVTGDLADTPAHKSHKRAWPKRPFPGSKADRDRKLSR